MNLPDFYKLLDVRRNATQAEIIEAAKRKNSELKKALAILTNPAKRKIYDAKLGQPAIKLPTPVMTYKPALIHYLTPLLWLLVGAVAWFYPVNALAGQIAMGIAASAGLWLLARIFSRAEVELGDDHVSVTTPSGKTHEWPLHQIRTLEIRQNTWQKLTNTGTVNIETQADEQFSFVGLGAPLIFLAHYQDIREHFDSALWTGRINIPGQKAASPQPLSGQQAEMLLKIRYLGMAEGTSLLLLLGVAMPLKYYLGIPTAVYWIGSAHGILFVLYLVYLITGKFTVPLPLKFMLLGMLASILPFGTFMLDKKLKRYKPTQNTTKLLPNAR